MNSLKPYGVSEFTEYSVESRYVTWNPKTFVCDKERVMYLDSYDSEHNNPENLSSFVPAEKSAETAEESAVEVSVDEESKEESKEESARNYIDIKKDDVKIGDSFFLGEYEQDNDLTNGREPIEWRVIGEDENGLLAISEYVLENMTYHNEPVEVLWQDCQIRSWLNGDFYNESFTEKEKKYIKESEVTNYTGYEDAETDYYTTDLIFLLTYSEAEKYFETKEERRTVATPYSNERGVIINGGSPYWLRNKSVFHTDDMIMGSGVDVGGYSDYNMVAYGPGIENRIGVRPCFYIQK
ncbi:MAG: DUF6273 domain-containing protein [Clostridia bacterium]|nr:DUF6273 domain-containing protein [Clostridia bacterium]